MLQFKIQNNFKGSAFVQRAADWDLPFHHVNDIFGYRHTQACSIYFTLSRIFGSFKWLKNICQKFFFHADTAVADDKTIGSIIDMLRRQFWDHDIDLPALRCKFDGIANDIQQDLIQSDSITNYLFMA